MAPLSPLVAGTLQSLQMQATPMIRPGPAHHPAHAPMETPHDTFIESPEAVAAIGDEAPREEPHERQDEPDHQKDEEDEPPHIDVLA